MGTVDTVPAYYRYLKCKTWGYKGECIELADLPVTLILEHISERARIKGYTHMHKHFY